MLKAAEKPADDHTDDDQEPHSSVTKAAIRGDAKDVGGVAGARLRAFLERIERLEGEKSGLADDIKEVYAEAKGVGFDTKIMKRVLKLRKMEVQKRREEDEILQLYLSAIGMDV